MGEGNLTGEFQWGGQFDWECEWARSDLTGGGGTCNGYLIFGYHVAHFGQGDFGSIGILGHL